MPKMSGADFISGAIKQAGLTHVFLVPTHLFASLVDLDGTGIRRIMTHGEKAAAYMADGYAKASYRPGLVITQGGPGGTNLVAGLAEPWMSRTPVIAITRAQHYQTTYRHQYQEVYADWRNVTKCDLHVETLERFPNALRQAFREATTGVPGPVHIESQVSAEMATADLPDAYIEERFTHYPVFRPEPEAQAIRDAAQALFEANRPVLVAGGGVMTSQAWEEIVELAELLQMPVATSLSGKGCIPENHPLAVGVVGTYSRDCACDMVVKSDLALFVGIHAGSQSTNNWTVPPVGHPVIQIDVDPAQLGKNYPNKVPVIGDAKVCLRRLIDELKQRTNVQPKTAWANEAREIVRAWWNKHREYYESDASPIRPERLCRELSEWLPADAAIVADTGYAGAWAGAFIEMRGKPGRNFFRCEGSLGWAFPAAIGVKCGIPNRPVVCFTGDGGFYYHLSEMETAVRYGINTVTVVLNNRSLIFDSHILDRLFDGGGQELAEFQPMDFAVVANSFGALGIRVERPEQISPAIQRALEAGKPAVVDVVVERSAHAPVRGGNTPLTMRQSRL